MVLAYDNLRWEQEGRDWPNREASRFVDAAGLRWHVQQLGQGPVVLLLHGTGAATHSWRGLAPLLARHFTVVAPDLPGHGFTEALPARRLSLSGMAKAIADLLHQLDVSPEMAVGHSAGAAILVRMCLDGLSQPRLMISLNGALLPFPGMAGKLFPPIAKALFLNPVVPRLFAFGVSRDRAERLLRDTGSKIDPAGLDLYARLFQSPRHIAGALGMMANWNLEDLERALHRLTTPLVLAVGERDGTVPPSNARRIARMVQGAELVRLPKLGHLAHEEQPEVVADLVIDRARAAGVLAAN